MQILKNEATTKKKEKNLEDVRKMREIALNQIYLVNRNTKLGKLELNSGH